MEQLFKVEQKAREYGFNTEIQNGGDHIKFYKRLTLESDLFLNYHNENISFGIPATYMQSIEEFGNVLKEQEHLLELAEMLNYIVPKPAKPLFDF